MAQLEVFQRYLHIVQLLLKRPASFSEILNFLNLQGEQDGNNYNISNRTFLRDKDGILSLFKLEIIYDESEKVYKIAEGDGLESIPARLVEAFNTFNALQFNSSIPNAIQLEYQKPKGIEHFRKVLQSISQQKELLFEYQKFDDTNIDFRTIRPLLLKEFKNRWYVIGIDCAKDELRTFGLDRMNEVQLSTKKFKKDTNFNPETYFQNAFGVIYGEATEVENILLKFKGKSINYIKTMPLHHSQKITKETNTEIYVQFMLFPSPDFVAEILSYGYEVEVIEPLRLKKAVKNALKKAIEQYNT